MLGTIWCQGYFCNCLSDLAISLTYVHRWCYLKNLEVGQEVTWPADPFVHRKLQTYQGWWLTASTLTWFYFEFGLGLIFQAGVSFSGEGCMFTRLNFSGKVNSLALTAGCSLCLSRCCLLLATLTSLAPANRFTSAQPNFIRSIYLSIALGIGVCLMPIFVPCPNKKSCIRAAKQ